MAKPMLLNKGDVIKTVPMEGYWGCALVLSSRDKVDGFDPMCHIAITPLIFRHTTMSLVSLRFPPSLFSNVTLISEQNPTSTFLFDMRFA